MTPETQQKVWQWVSETANQIKDWGSKEIPSFITEYLQWKFASSMIDIVGWSLLVVIVGLVVTKLTPKVVKLAIKAHDESSTYDGEGRAVLAVIAAIIACIASFAFCMSLILNFPKDQIKECVQIKVAPKVYLIERAAEFIKQ